MSNTRFIQPATTRVEGISLIREAWILSEGKKIGIVAEETNDADESDWVIKIDWKAWEEAGEPFVPGIDTDLRLDEYIRAFVPQLVSERTIPENRQSLQKELARVGMTSYDRYEYMCRTHGRCGNNRLTIERKTPISEKTMELQ